MSGAGREKPNPRGGRGWGVNIHPRRAGAGREMGSRGRGWGKQNPTPTRPVAMPTLKDQH